MTQHDASLPIASRHKAIFILLLDLFSMKNEEDFEVNK